MLSGTLVPFNSGSSEVNFLYWKLGEIMKPSQIADSMRSCIWQK